MRTARQPGGSALEWRTSAVERAVQEAYQRFLAPRIHGGMALAAVGGFGRGELFPHSDVDLLIVVERQGLAERERSAISAFLQDLWDRGLRVSQSVHTPDECAERQEQNLELTISLLDQRYLAGDRTLHAGFSVALAGFVHAQRAMLARDLAAMARDRHRKNGGSIHQLEPNVKESPGGLRDYQLVRWLTQIRSSHPDSIPHPAPPAELTAAREFLFEVRRALHERAGRDMNTLSFDYQDELAERLGVAPAAWMRHYYLRAREVHRAALREIDLAEEQASNLLVQFRRWRSRVANADFSVMRERVYFRAPQQLEYDPGLALKLFEFVGRHGLPLAQETERRLADRLPQIRTHFAQPGAAAWPALKPILATPHCSLALRTMHETGALGALLPGWDNIDCLVVRDFYHRYTVDEHTLVAIRTLEKLRGAQEPMARRFARLLEEVDDPEHLTLALLLHDLGKAKPGGPHVPESVRIAENAMARLGLPPERRETVRLLIERHLEFSLVMTSRDLEDRATARLLAERTGTLELARKLALLTYADIAAVNPTALSPWRMEQLWRVYLAAHNGLTRELPDHRVAAESERDPFLEGLPVRYLRTHSEAEIAAHRELERRSGERGVAIDIRRDNGFYHLSVVTRDRRHLLASLAGALAAFGLNILKAEGFANRQGVVLDTFVFADPHRTLELNPPEADRLRLMLERVTLGRADVKALLANRPKPQRPSQRARVPFTVSFDNDASETATLIEVVAEDRPGLLYDLASAISATGANIDLVLIDTEAHRAIDVFYVTAEGRKLDDGRQALLRDRLISGMDGPAGR